MKSNNYLVISDLQIPFEHEQALSFCRYLQKEFKIPKENILCVGDELDQLFGSHYQKNPDIHLSALEEIEISKKKLKDWYGAFPMMRVAISNHGLRWLKKALMAEIPSQIIRPYKEIIDAPVDWKWKDEWVIKAERETFRMIHGMGYCGQAAAKNAALDSGMSTVIGHIHSFGGITYHRTMGRNKMIWAANSGCLIDETALAFQYGKYSRNKPTLGCIVILDGGRTPLFIPFE